MLKQFGGPPFLFLPEFFSGAISLNVFQWLARILGLKLRVADGIQGLAIPAGGQFLLSLFMTISTGLLWSLSFLALVLLVVLAGYAWRAVAPQDSAR
jgi:hypothetical protein